MKKIILSLLVGFISMTSIAKSGNDELKSEAKIYFDYIANKNIDKIIDCMYPEVFKAVSRADLKAGMEQMFNNPGMDVEFLKTDINSVSDKVAHNGIDYLLLNYTSDMKMTFLSEIEKPKEERETFLDYMKNVMVTQFGEKNVMVNYDETSILITSTTDMYAISNSKYDGWKFIGNDDAMKSIINLVIPEEVRNQLFAQH